ncbi:hypothetical protein N7527_005537 [Penicillium freii]|nr:hypothetical protein N7527_005537 [Penicillium freii]
MFKALIGGRRSSSDGRSSSKSSRRRSEKPDTSDERSISSRKSSQGDEQSNLTYPALGITSTEMSHTQKMESPRTLYKVGWEISHQCDNLKRLVGDGTEQSSAIFNELQRFELWATNLGLYHRGHSSLDYRCRDSPLVFNHALGLLRDLERALQQFQDSLLNIHEEDDDTNHGTDRHIVNDQEDFPGSDDSDEEDFSSYQTEPLTDAYLANIISTIDRLYSLAFKIRNPAMRLGMSKAATYSEIDPETKTDLIKEFEQIDRLHVEELFRLFGHSDPDPRHYLIRRLAKANTRRRQQFRYWNRRRAKYEVLGPPQQPEITSREMEKPPASQSELPMVRPASETLKASTATWLDEKKVNLDDDTSVVSSSNTFFSMSSQQDDDRAGIPPPPTVEVSAKEFESCFSLPRSSGNDGSASSDKEVSHGAQIDSDSSADLSISSVYHDQGNLDDADSMPALEQIRIPKDAGDDNTAERLLDACYDGDYGLVRLLLEEGSDVSIPDRDKWLALQAASSAGHVEIVRLLLNYGADVNASKGGDMDALSSASLGGHTEVVRLLLNYGAEVDLLSLQVASNKGHTEIVRLLLNYRPDVDAPALQIASRKGYTEIIQLLLAHGADVDAQREYDENALQAASAGGHVEVVQLLLAYGADINAQGGVNGNALHAASINGHAEIVQLLLASGADVDAQNKDGGNALLAACINGYKEIVQVLLAYGADVDARSGDGENALQAASRHGQSDIVQLLLARGAGASTYGSKHVN